MSGGTSIFFRNRPMKTSTTFVSYWCSCSQTRSHKSVRVKTGSGSRISTRADNSVRHSPPRWNSRSGTNRARGYIFLFYQRLAELQAQIQPIQPKPTEAHVIEPVTDQPALPSNETIPGSGAENGLPER